MIGPRKLYNDKAINIATFFGGPLAAGYLMHKNYLALGEKEKARIALLLGFTGMLLLISLIILLPERILENMPSFIIPAIYTGIVALLFEYIQGKTIRVHKDAGGDFFSLWKAVGAGAVSMVILTGSLISGLLVSGNLDNVSADNYDHNLDKFFMNENIALAFFENADYLSSDELLIEINKSTYLWHQNKLIIDIMNSIENLPEELIIQNASLLKYCDLRIRYNELIMHSVTGQSDLMADLDAVEKEIEQLLEAFSK